MREKLIELLYHSGDECDQLCRTPQKGCHVCKYADCGAKCINVMEADYLIANGVTVREKGEWHTLTECSNEGVYCSVCHKKVYKADYAWCNNKNKVRSDFCPNCGADMRGDIDA